MNSEVVSITVCMGVFVRQIDYFTPVHVSGINIQPLYHDAMPLSGIALDHIPQLTMHVLIVKLQPQVLSLCGHNGETTCTIINSFDHNAQPWTRISINFVFHRFIMNCPDPVLYIRSFQIKSLFYHPSLQVAVQL